MYYSCLVLHVLQWRRRMTHDEVLLDGKSQQISYGLFGRETIYGLVFGKDEEVILICDSGGRSSFLARALVEQLGYKNVFNVTDGISGWMKDGKPVVSTDQ